jgi:hypothetical protein
MDALSQIETPELGSVDTRNPLPTMTTDIRTKLSEQYARGREWEEDLVRERHNAFLWKNDPVRLKLVQRRTKAEGAGGQS